MKIRKSEELPIDSLDPALVFPMLIVTSVSLVTSTESLVTNLAISAPWATKLLGSNQRILVGNAKQPTLTNVIAKVQSGE